MEKNAGIPAFSAVVRSCFRSSPVVSREVCHVDVVGRNGKFAGEQMAELSGHLAGACSGRRAELLHLHISDSGRIPLKEQAGIVLKTSHNPVLSLAETLPGNAADLCGQGILFGFASGKRWFSY